ncbi:hypothetical protein DIPPA_19937 [Diplonema papillatum]|nr:hypothetical protein DIPPA_19937 [Diplonema papillatum]
MSIPGVALVIGISLILAGATVCYVLRSAHRRDGERLAAEAYNYAEVESNESESPELQNSSTTIPVTEKLSHPFHAAHSLPNGSYAMPNRRSPSSYSQLSQHVQVTPQHGPTPLTRSISGLSASPQNRPASFHSMRSGSPNELGGGGGGGGGYADKRVSVPRNIKHGFDRGGRPGSLTREGLEGVVLVSDSPIPFRASPLHMDDRRRDGGRSPLTPRPRRHRRGSHGASHTEDLDELQIMSSELKEKRKDLSSFMAEQVAYVADSLNRATPHPLSPAVESTGTFRLADVPDAGASFTSSNVALEELPEAHTFDDSSPQNSPRGGISSANGSAATSLLDPGSPVGLPQTLSSRHHGSPNSRPSNRRSATRRQQQQQQQQGPLRGGPISSADVNRNLSPTEAFIDPNRSITTVPLPISSMGVPERSLRREASEVSAAGLTHVFDSSLYSPHPDPKTSPRTRGRGGPNYSDRRRTKGISPVSE